VLLCARLSHKSFPCLLVAMGRHARDPACKAHSENFLIDHRPHPFKRVFVPSLGTTHKRKFFGFHKTHLLAFFLPPFFEFSLSPATHFSTSLPHPTSASSPPFSLFPACLSLLSSISPEERVEECVSAFRCPVDDHLANSRGFFVISCFWERKRKSHEPAEWEEETFRS
jgi:hypothetical protein